MDTEYQYDNKDDLCCSKELKPLFESIKFQDYLEPYKRLAEYYKGTTDNYYEKIINTNINFDKPLRILGHEYPKNDILLQYLRCFPSCRVAVVWPKGYAQTVYTKIESQTKIHAIKEVDLTPKQITAALYYLNYDKQEYKDYKFILEKKEVIGVKEQVYRISCIFFEDVPNVLPVSDEYFLSTSFNETVETAKLFLNKNSLRLLQYADLHRFLTFKDSKSMTLIQTFKNWMYNVISPIDHNRFLMMGSIVLFSLGLREINDLDCLMHHIPADAETPNLIKKIGYFFKRPDAPFSNIDLAIKGHWGWVPGGKFAYQDQWYEKDWPNLYGSTSMSDTIFNPKFHYYFLGLKVIIFKADMARRIKRNRPAALADLIALEKILGIKSGYPRFGPDDEAQLKKSIDQMKNKVSYYLKKRYKLRMTSRQVVDYVNEFF